MGPSMGPSVGPVAGRGWLGRILGGVNAGWRGVARSSGQSNPYRAGLNQVLAGYIPVKAMMKFTTR